MDTEGNLERRAVACQGSDVLAAHEGAADVLLGTGNRKMEE